jgi:hypothetical protein
MGAEEEKRKTTPGTEEFKQEIVAKAKEILEESGAYNCARTVIEEGWVYGRIVEQEAFPIKDNQHTVPIGLHLFVKSPASGCVDFYYGEGFLIRAEVETGSIMVRSGTAPVIITPDEKRGWTEERKEIVKATVLEAYQHPGSYRWIDGEYGETWQTRSSPVIKK